MSPTHIPTSSRTSPRQLVQWLVSGGHSEGPLLGPGDRLLLDVAALEFATESDVAYCDESALPSDVADCGAGCLIVPAKSAAAIAEACPEKAIIPASEPQAAFIAVMMRFRPARQTPPAKIALDAYISPTAKVGERVHIGANVYIGDEAEIGDGCIIHPNAYIGHSVKLGEDCTIQPGVVVHHDCQIGSRTILNANCVIGADGFGFRFETDHYERIPHTGRVQIGSDCEVGACTTIDRGMIEDTVIGDGTKLDNLVMIAHNCRIGSHNAAAALVGLAGSVTTDSYVRFGGNAGVADHCHIGQGVSVGGKAAIIGDVPAGATFHGIPAAPASDALRKEVNIKRLPEMKSQIRDLQRQVDAITSDLQTDRRAA